MLVITGGTKGIGREVLELFASKGQNIITCSKTEQDLLILQEEISKKYKVKIWVKRTDLSQKEEVLHFTDFVKEIIEKENQELDILINNAGIFIDSPLHQAENEVLETLMNTNFYSAFYLTQALLDTFKHQEKGHIFTICSADDSGRGAYTVSKTALLGMNKVLHQELRPLGIKVTALLLGATLTPSWEEAKIPKEYFITVQDVAETIFNTYSLSKHASVEQITIEPSKKMDF
jgi:short-subunit dehydrogenase